MAKYTKTDIERLAKEIFAWAGRHRLGKDFGVFYNGKVKQWTCDKRTGEWEYHMEIKDGVNPLDYCEWFDERFIGGMWYDGQMYECINGYNRNTAFEKLEKLLERYGLYLEHCDSCHCTFCPMDALDDYEYTLFEKERPIWLCYLDRDAFERKCKEIAAVCTTKTCGRILGGDEDGWKTYQKLVMETMGNTSLGDIPDMNIASVMYKQYDLAKEVGDKGACTIGEYIEFRYKGTLYRMGMQTPYQGDYSWQATIPEVKRLLEVFGATEIYVNYGRLD